MHYKYFSMFSGIGGFEYGIERATNNTWECVGYSEIDKYAIKCYEQHYPNHRNFGDCTRINADELPDFDMLCGGFPCQAFSIAGKRGGFEDTRGTLFFEIARIVKIKRPKIILLENVKGLLNHNKGETFKVIIQTLGELGYDVQWMVLNSKFFGVPQNRERTIIIGSIRGERRPEILPFGVRCSEINEGGDEKSFGTLTANMFKQNWQTPTISIKDTNIGRGMNMIADYRNDEGLRIRENFISPTLTSHGNSNGGVPIPYIISHSPRCGDPKKGGTGLLTSDTHCFTLDTSPHYVAGTLRTHKDGNGFREMQEGISPTIPARAREDGSGQPCIAVLTPDREEKRQNGRRFKENEEPMFTLTTQDKHGVFDGLKIRRLTPIECERLQAFEDNWTNMLSDTQRYKTLGNAVTTNVIKSVIEKINGDPNGI